MLRYDFNGIVESIKSKQELEEGPRELAGQIGKGIGTAAGKVQQAKQYVKDTGKAFTGGIKKAYKQTAPVAPRKKTMAAPSTAALKQSAVSDPQQTTAAQPDTTSATTPAATDPNVKQQPVTEPAPQQPVGSSNWADFTQTLEDNKSKGFVVDHLIVSAPSGSKGSPPVTVLDSTKATIYKPSASNVIISTPDKKNKISFPSASLKSYEILPAPEGYLKPGDKHEANVLRAVLKNGMV
jgi:hypothetical protein